MFGIKQREREIHSLTAWNQQLLREKEALSGENQKLREENAQLQAELLELREERRMGKQWDNLMAYNGTPQSPIEKLTE